MTLRLPSRYEDLHTEFRGRLKPNRKLITEVQNALASSRITGGVRFFPVVGLSGSGKTSATLQLSTHLPEISVHVLSRSSITSREEILSEVNTVRQRDPERSIVCVIDQYEEAVATRENVPTAFIEAISLLDRNELRDGGVLFVWLTTSEDFAESLRKATTRNARVLANKEFRVVGPEKAEWPSIIEETFEFHNSERSLADFQVLSNELEDLSYECSTMGDAISRVGSMLQPHVDGLHDLSEYQVVILWPVTDGTRISRIQQITDARRGYKLDWSSWFRQLNDDDRSRPSLKELNKARLYFDVRLVPIAAADLQMICKDIEKAKVDLSKTALERLRASHFYSIVSGSWSDASYSPLRERVSKRAEDAREWYKSVTDKPTQIGRRLAQALQELELDAKHEQDIKSPSSAVRADVLVKRDTDAPSKIIVELKAFSPENTMPSTISAAVRVTLNRHAQLAGFLSK